MNCNVYSYLNVIGFQIHHNFHFFSPFHFVKKKMSVLFHFVCKMFLNVHNNHSDQQRSKNITINTLKIKEFKFV